MKVLVTGGAGYLGSVLVPKLLARGHQVRVVDLGYYGLGHIRSYRPVVEVVREDIRQWGTDAGMFDRLLDGCDGVIHLAAISNDPSAELNPSLTREVNYEATCSLAEAAKARRIKFLFSSSCSVYGQATTDQDIDEDGHLNPITAYAQSKVDSERFLTQLADANWAPVILRNGTLFGYSPRMRFDLVINIFSLYSTLHNRIHIFGHGQQWRPYLHVNDCARAFVFLAEKRSLAHLVYNVAHANLRVVDVAELFRQMNPALDIVHQDQADPDNRDYRVSSARLQAEGFHAKISVELGAEGLVEAIITGAIPDPESIFYRNAKWMKELTSLGSKKHKDLVGLMETIASLRPPLNPGA